MSAPIHAKILSDIVTELKTVPSVQTVDTTFYTISQVPSDAHLSVLFNDELVESQNDPKTTFRNHIEVGVFGYLKANTLTQRGGDNALVVAREAMLHNVLVVLAGLTTKYINADSGRWAFEKYADTFRVVRDLPDESLRGVFAVYFSVFTLAQDATFEL